jgi:hypothetical protein
MNTINPYDSTSFADFEPLPDAPPPPSEAKPEPEDIDADDVSAQPAAPCPEEQAEPGGIDRAEAAMADADLDLPAPACADDTAQPAIDADPPVITVPVKLFDIREILRKVSGAISNYFSSLLAITLRTPLFRPDAQLMERLTRTDEETRRDDGLKSDLRRKLVTQEPLEVTTSQLRIQRVVGDEIVVETITTEHQNRSMVTGEGQVVAENETTSTRHT